MTTEIVSNARRYFHNIDDALNKGNLFGPYGALFYAECYVKPAAKGHDIPSMMKLANVYYTASGNISRRRGLVNKLRAAHYLHEAKSWATRAFLGCFSTKNLHSALVQADVQLHLKRPLPISYGDVHILMSCYAQWATQLNARLRLPMMSDKEIVRDCYTVLRRSGNEGLVAMSAGTLKLLPDIDNKTYEHCVEVLQRFVQKHYANLRNSPQADPGFVQAVCRAARALGDDVSLRVAAQLAQKHGLTDQLEKATPRS